MADRELNAAVVPTPEPWHVRGEAGEAVPARDGLLSVAPAAQGGRGGPPYVIHQGRALMSGDTALHLAAGIQHLADARLMAAAPDLTVALLRLFTAPTLAQADLDPHTHVASLAARKLLVRVASHLELWAEHEPSPRNRH